MKTTILLLLAAVLAALSPSVVRAADDLYVAFEEGRAAFNAGQLEIAREKLAYVLSKSPDHIPTRAMMAQIEARLGPSNTMLRKSYEKIIIDKVEFADVTVEESIQAIRMLTQKATQNKVVPNIIVKGEGIGEKVLSLNLSRVPLSEVLNYVAQLSGSRLVYDKNAVVFASPTTAPPAPAVTPAPTPTTPGFQNPSNTTTRQALMRDSLNDPFAPRKS